VKIKLKNVINFT